MAKKYDWIFKAIKEAPLSTKLEALRKSIFSRLSQVSDLEKCALCPNMCRHACPVSIVSGSETLSPAGKARIAFFIEEGELKLEEGIKPLYYCLSCNACSEYCPFGLSVFDLLLSLRMKAVEGGMLDERLWNKLKNLKEKGNIYGERFLEEESEGDVLYLRGCVLRKNFPEVERDTMRLFEKLGVSLKKINEKCCGIPAYNLGDLETFKELAKENVEKIAERGIDKVVASCPSCVYAYRVLYQKFGIRVPFEVKHVTEEILPRIRSLNICYKEEITYHDPCKLSRNLDRPEILRKILLEIKGMKVIDPWRRGKHTFCCGGSGSYISTIDPELSKKIAIERAKELMEASEHIVTACPSCLLSFRRVGVNVIDISSFLLRAMGEKP